MTEQLWYKDGPLWTPAADRIHTMLKHFKCKPLSKWWYFDSNKKKIIHVCKVELDAQGIPTHIGTLDTERQFCDLCKLPATNQVLMMARLQKLNNLRT